MPAGWDWAQNDLLSGVFNYVVIFLCIFCFLLLRIDDIEDNSKLRRGIPGNVGWNIQAYSQANINE